jgi:glycosyltransferase involved in cell wall biosynthesis
MRRRIGILLDSLPLCGGIFQYDQTILQALHALPQDQFQPVVLYSHREWESYLVNQQTSSLYVKHSIFSRFLNAVMNRSRFPTAYWRRISKHLLSIPRTLTNQNCHLWVFPSQDYWGYNADVISLITIHDLMHRYEPRFPEVSSWGEYGKREKHYRRICNWAKGILVDSKLGQDHVIESYGVDRSRIHVLPYTVPQYILSPGQPPEFDTKYALPDKFFFYPAQFWKHKNHVNLVKAMAKIHDRIPDLHFVFLGSEKNALARTRRLIAELDLQPHVTIFRYIPDCDMTEFYRRARAMVMPSFFGPTNIPPIEAMAAGCPVAVSNVYAMPDQMGDAAILFSPESVDDIATALYRLWQDDGLCAELVGKGRKRIKELSQSRFNNDFLQIVTAVLKTVPPQEELT